MLRLELHHRAPQRQPAAENDPLKCSHQSIHCDRHTDFNTELQPSLQALWPACTAPEEQQPPTSSPGPLSKGTDRKSYRSSQEFNKKEMQHPLLQLPLRETQQRANVKAEMPKTKKKPQNVTLELRAHAQEEAASDPYAAALMA